MEIFLPVVAYVGMALLIWDCIEVGRNDAANLVNAVFGARVMTRRVAVYIAGVAVVLGATFASPVMETARKGIFDPVQLSGPEALVTVYITAYVVDTVLLYTFSAFGMPISTTASLVFSLVGGAIGVSLGTSIVDWSKIYTVIEAIILSIILSGIAGFMIQRAFRGAIGEDARDPVRVKLHGPWIAGLIVTWLTWFMVMKGLKGVSWVSDLKDAIEVKVGMFPFLLALWAGSSLLVYGGLLLLREKGTQYLFHVTAVLGMICMAFAFGQNDLANCASPGLSAWWVYQHADESIATINELNLPIILLFSCGLLMALGMGTKTAQRVTRAEVNTGSQYDQVRLWAPAWCIAIARRFVREEQPQTDIAPPPSTTADGKRIHYDTLRASVIMAISASVIAFASGRGLPVSTTYVAFAAVVATGWGDRVFHRGDAALKLGRALWVVTCWFLASFIAMIASGFVAITIYRLEVIGLAICLGCNLFVRGYFKRRADAHELKYHKTKSATDDEEAN